MAGTSYSWTSLGKGGSEIEASAKKEALELARALAAQTIVGEHDAVVEELPDRTRAIADTMWPDTPLSGYGLHSSLGAYLVAKVAVGWSPSGMIGLRREPLDREGLLDDLIDHGVDRAVAAAIIGDWPGVEAGFIPDPRGLDASHIAGLAECALTRRERARALSQIAFSARCLDRTRSTANVLASLRNVLAVLPPTSLGRELTVGMAAIALGRPDRAVELIGDRPPSLSERTIVELAFAIAAFKNGRTPALSDEGAVLAPGFEGEELPRASREEDQSDDDRDDVLENVEERVDPGPGSGANGANGASAAAAQTRSSRTPRPARWPASEGPLDAETLNEWQRRFDSSLGVLGERRGVLGLRLPAAPPTISPKPIPPDERIVGLQLARATGVSVGTMPLESLRLSGTMADAIFPSARGALRAIVQAVGGRAPAESSLQSAGDLAWLLQRAKALSFMARDDAGGALASVRGLTHEEAPEGRWAADRMRRFGQRAPERADVIAVYTAAAALARDLALQLGRTIAGTLPDAGDTERMG